MAEPNSDASIPDLIRSAAHDTQLLISDQIELTKTELRASVSSAGRAFGLMAAAAFVGILFVVFLLVTIAYILVALGLPTWAGFGIVALVLLIAAAILALVGRKNAGAVQPPTHSMAQLEASQQAIVAAVSPSSAGEKSPETAPATSS